MGYYEINPCVIEEASAEIAALGDAAFRDLFTVCLRSAKSGVWEGEGEAPWYMWHFRYRVGGHRQKHWDRKALWSRFLGICYLCNDTVDADEFEVEHVVPLARGGDDLEHNLNIAHKACNLRKGTQLLSELDWYAV